MLLIKIMLMVLVLPFSGLDSPNFSARQKAHQIIFESGDIGAIREEMKKHNTPEKSARLRVLVQQLEHHDLQIQLRNIARGKESTYPGWKEWSSVAGKGTVARDHFYVAIKDYRKTLFDFMEEEEYRNGIGISFAGNVSREWDSAAFVVLTIMYKKTGRDTYREALKKIVRNYGQWYDACIYNCTLCEEHYYADKDYMFIRGIALKLDEGRNDGDVKK